MLPLLLFVFFIVIILNHIKEKSYHTVSLDIVERKPKRRNELTRLLDNISSADKIILENIKERMIITKDIMEEDLKGYIIEIVRKVLKSINNVSKHTFFVNTIENMYIMKDDRGNFRCILACFIFEVSKFYTIKLSMDIVSYEGEIYFNYVDIDESSINNILNKYDVKWDGMGILSNYDMFNENMQQILDNYYNTNYNIVYLNNHTIDIDKTGTFTLSQLTNSYLPSNIPKDESSPYFCQKNSSNWNYKGIQNKGNESCISNNNSYSTLPNIPMNGPSTIVHNPDNNTHQWLFSKGHGPLKSSGQY
tara:strand:- start:53 stop:970 length:918 start_codon:yes stop_codon:yes gene_type:complete